MATGRVLIIAGSDSGGGAGIQADIKTVTALGGYAATAITAVTAQDTLGVHGVVQLDANFIRQQIEVVLHDIGADCIKIGMIGDLAAAEVIAQALRGAATIPVVLDPVLVATSGDALGGSDVAAFINSDLVPLATVVTPNVPELEALTGTVIKDEAALLSAAQTLQARGAQAILAKGGHLAGETLTDLLVTAEEVVRMTHDRIETRHTHGTGCTLASALAAGLAQGLDLKAATARSVAYVEAAIRYAPGLGEGHGPLCHALRSNEDGSFKPIA